MRVRNESFDIWKIMYVTPWFPYLYMFYPFMPLIAYTLTVIPLITSVQSVILRFIFLCCNKEVNALGCKEYCVFFKN